MSFKDLDIGILYSGWGEDMLNQLVLPLLKEARQYDRVTSFFTTESLVAISEGLDSLWDACGSMRLVLGIHDVPADLLEAVIAADDPSAKLVSEVRARILSEAATIQEQIVIQRLATIAWMIQDHLLEIKVAVPATIRSGPPGLFHNKLLIFNDDQGNRVIGVGSPNETGAGLGSNFEHLTVFSSWEQPRHTDAHAHFFESLWKGNQDGLTIQELDETFAEELLGALSRPPRPPRKVPVCETTIQALLDAAQAMPALSLLSGKHAPLFPHQERVYVDALSRWPVRVMLADEVGLGKTFEAAAVLRQLLDHSGARRALILAPKAVVYQWQAELYENFGLDAWVLDSGRRAYVSATGETRLVPRNDPILGPTSPGLVIISSQYARGNRKTGHILKNLGHVADVLIVDEAHSARVRPDLDGSERPTLMWRLLDDLTKRIPHVIFATATPMQIHWREYHALLDLLGLPSEWREPANYETSLDLVTTEESPTLADARSAASMIISCVSEMKPKELQCTVDELGLIEGLLAAEDAFGRADLIQQRWHCAQRLLTKLHPARLLTMRNTRGALEKVGYQFPKRRLEAPSLRVPTSVSAFYSQVDEYLSKVYYEVERALYADRSFNSGFVKCSYQQRLASSLEACMLSLARRRNRIENIIESVECERAVQADAEELSDSDLFDDAEISLFEEPATAYDKDEVLHAARIESQYLEDLIAHLTDILAAGPDPKMLTAIELVERHLNRGDSVLVFSRYTDTLDSVIRAYREHMGDSGSVGFGVYTGQKADIDLGTGARRSTRLEIRQALDRRAVRLVFCSDAASEGLNLQAARVIVNVDVPWNPARLEQRIGRIARLGQRASAVDIYNLWYPDSIEARMYKRLMDRHDLYELAVGEFPEVISEAIRMELAARYGGPSNATDPLAKLQELRKDLQVAALRRLWARDSPSDTLTVAARREIADLAGLAARATGGRYHVDNEKAVVEVSSERYVMTFEPGEDHAASYSHPALRWLAGSAVSPRQNIGAWYHQAGPAYFAYQDAGTWRTIAPEAVNYMLRVVAGLDSSTDLPAEIETDQTGRPYSEWLPDPARLTIPCELTCGTPDRPAYTIDEMQLKPFGRGSERK